MAQPWSSSFPAELTDQVIVTELSELHFAVAHSYLRCMEQLAGSLSPENQVRMCEALIGMGGYGVAEQLASRYTDEGNGLPQLQLVRGIAMLQQGKAADAMALLRERPEWARWYRRAELECRGRDVIEVGPPDGWRIVFEDSPRLVQVAITGPTSELRVTIHGLWVDVIVGKVVEKRIRLFAAVNPEVSTWRMVDGAAHLKLTKVRAGRWPCLEGSGPLAVTLLPVRPPPPLPAPAPVLKSWIDRGDEPLPSLVEWRFQRPTPARSGDAGRAPAEGSK